MQHVVEEKNKVVKEFTGSLGLQCEDWESGVVTNVRQKSQAIKLGIAPGMKIIAIDGKRFSKALLTNAIKDKCDHKITITCVENEKTVKILSHILRIVS